MFTMIMIYGCFSCSGKTSVRLQWLSAAPAGCGSRLGHNYAAARVTLLTTSNHDHAGNPINSTRRGSKAGVHKAWVTTAGAGPTFFLTNNLKFKFHAELIERLMNLGAATRRVSV